MRDLYHGHTPMVLRPGSVAEVSAILKLANETQTPIVPQGGNTGLVGGQIPHHGEIVLSLKRLDKIREVDATLEHHDLRGRRRRSARARRRPPTADRLFPLLAGAEGSCTIGGNLSTNAGGTGALAYGMARELVLGLEVVLADGRVLNELNKLKKDNTGYDLKNLFIGAEGTLGIITAAVLKLSRARARSRPPSSAWPRRQRRSSCSASRSERTGGGVTGFELMPRIGIECGAASTARRRAIRWPTRIPGTC